MRIILATPIYPPEIGGPATYTRELAERLRGDHDITIVAYADEPEAIEGVKILAVSKKILLPVRLIRYFFILLREVKTADLIYVQNAVASGLPAVLAGLLCRKPVVLKFVGDEAWERATQDKITNQTLERFLATPPAHPDTLLFIKIQKFVLGRASKVLPPSEFLARILKKYYAVVPQKVEVNYNAFEGEAAPVGEKKQHQVASVGRLVVWKGVDGVIRAIDIVRKEFPDIQLVIAGSGPEESALKKLAEDLKLQDTVSFAGRLSRKETERLQAQSEVLVLNSTYEGLPHIALEGFAAKTPLIATDIGGTSEVVLDEKTGILVEPGSDMQVAMAIARLFKDIELQKRLVENGERLLKEKFSWEAHIQNLLAVFTLLKQS